MKTLRRCPLTVALLLLCAAFHVPPLAAAPAPDYHTRAVKLAAEFIRSAKDPADEAAWKEFVEKRGIAGKQFTAACAEAVAVGRALVADGVPAASDHFTGILADTFAVTPPATPTTKTETTAATPTPKSAEKEPPKVAEADKLAHQELEVQIAKIDGEIAALEKKALANTEPKPTARELQENADALAAARGMRQLLATRREVLELRQKVALAEKAKEAADQTSDEAKKKTAAGDLSTKRQTLAAAELNEKALANQYGTQDSISTGGAVKFFHAGLRQQNPYTLKIQTDDATKETHGYLENGSKEVSGFLEFVYSNRWAWNASRTAAAEKVGEHVKGSTVARGQSYGFIAPGFTALTAPDLWDFETRIGFGLAKDDKIDAGAVAGSGDVSIDLNVARHLSRGRFPGDDGYASLNLEFGYGISTRTDSFDALQRIFAGPSYTVSFPSWGGGDTPAFLQMRAGAAWVDTLEFKDEAKREIHLRNDTMPRYSLKSGWVVETDLIYPLSRSAHLTFGARIYGAHNPNPWSLYIGYTKSISDLAKALLPGGSETTDAAKKTTGPAL